MKYSADAAGVLALKAGAAVVQFVLLLLTARWFGVAFRGDIALFNASTNLLVLVVGFAGGSSIIYLAAREPSQNFVRSLLAVSYASCVILPVVVGFGASASGHPLGSHTAEMIFVTIMNALLVVHTCLLMSGSAVWQASLLEFLRPFCLLASVGVLFALRGPDARAIFYPVWCVSAAVALLASIPFVLAFYRGLPAVAADRPAPINMLATARRLLTLGFLAQASNLVQFLNYRSLFFALERHSGLAAVGLFSTAVALAEVMWIPANSLAALTLNRVSRAGDSTGSREYVLHMARLSGIIVVVGAVVVLLVPAAGIELLLGRDFGQVRGQLVSLLPGIVVIGVALIVSAYHAGHALYVRNLNATLAGLGLTAVGFLWLVPRFGAAGGSLAMNLSYFATSFVLFVSLARRERVRWQDCVPRRTDLTRPTSSPTSSQS